jgi:hypothetical protein
VILAMKRLAALLLTLGLITMSCATIGQVRVLGGTPRVETIGLTVGMTVEQLDKELGAPHGSDTCAFPFEAKGREAMAQGKAFLWRHEFSNIPDQHGRMSGIITCVMDGIVVGESREWIIVNGSVTSMGRSNSVDLDLVQAIMDNLLQSGGTRVIPMPYEKGFEI